jgi:predicted AAA+ superfamily ATPase
MSDPMERIAAALERISPAPLEAPDFDSADAFVWHVSPDRLDPVADVNRVDLELLVGIDRSRNRTPASLPAAFQPTTHCCGARVAWESRAL